MPEQPPAGGWQSPEPERPPDLDAFAQLAKALLDAIPPDLQARFVEAVRQLLMALRALIEWWIDRLEHRGAGGAPSEVRDIPVL